VSGRRSLSPITREHLDRLAAIAREDLEARFARRPQWARYRDRILCSALMQGAALHYLDGKNGVKDLDVYTFFAEPPAGLAQFPQRWRTCADFGSSSLGRDPTLLEYRGRRVDLFGRSLPVAGDSDPVEALRAYLAGRRTPTSRALAEKAAVLLWPEPLRGLVPWPVEG